MEAAALGHGVALGSTVLADRLLREGRLRPLFGPVLRVDDPYCLAYRPSSLRDDDIRTVCEWFRSRAAAWQRSSPLPFPAWPDPS
ncbi:LysR substrate-binding domain-containing protein [Inquilinus sp. CA228]|uniref:LysR substrate-binding domain-containing protein n=1 Tax=Inquilinus sp. CA228 TaxID=3455609 RepID=UPI003F8D825C